VAAAYCGGRDWGIAKDSAQCVQWWRKAAEAGLARAQFVLGQIYWDGDPVPRDATEAVKWLQMAANHFDDDAMALLGKAYETGQGVPQDYAQARHWYLLTANEYRYAYAAWFGLGEMSETGKGGPVDLYAAKAWYTKAAEGSWTKEGKEAKQRLDGLEAQLKAAEEKRQAESGDAAAQFQYAESLKYSDGKAAAEWYRKSAAQGNVAAMKALGGLYENGQGVDKDNMEAARWYKRAADTGDQDAKRKLADMLVDGKISALPGSNGPAKQPEAQPPQGPLTIKQIEELLKGSVSAVRVRAIVQQRGVDFALNSDYEKRLRAAGADDALIIAIAENKR
jgi:TPR repeat protein